MCKAGFVLIEKIAVIFVSCLVVLGVSDLFQILHVKLALRNAVDKSLRCLYPRDGICRNEGRNSEIKYDVYQSINNQNYLFPINRVSVFGNKYELPVYRYYNPVAEVLDSITYTQYSYPLYKIIPKDTYFGYAKYLVQVSEYPYINTVAGPYNAKYQYRINKEPYPVLNTSLGQNQNIASISGKTKSSLILGEVNFTIPNLPTLSCYKSANIDSANSLQADFSKSCSLSNVNLVIGVNGKYSLRNSSRGRIEINLIQGNKNINLGGRAYNLTPGGSANLVPRGASEIYVSDIHGYQEFLLHSPISVQRNSPIKIVFRLTKLSGDSSEYVDWTGLDLKLFGQEYRVVENEVNCIEQNCYQADNRLIPSQAIISYRKTTEMVSIPAGCSTNTELKKLSSEYYLAEHEPSCLQRTESQTCADNFGIMPSATSQDILKTCNINLEDYSDLKYNLKSKFINFSVEYKKEKCSEEFNYKIYPEISQYYKVNFLGKELINYFEDPLRQKCDDTKISRYKIGEFTSDQQTECNLEKVAREKFSFPSELELETEKIGEDIAQKIPSCQNNIKKLDDYIWTKINQEPVSLHVAQQLCYQCKYIANSTNDNYQGTSFFKAEYDYGYRYLKTAIPKLNWNCDGLNCGKVKASYSKGIYNVYAQVRIPLFFTKTLNLSLADWRKAEENY